MEAAKAILTQTVIDLFSNHNMKQTSIFDLIRSSILEHVSTLPERRVLYNDCYGGYSYSKEFKTYLEDTIGQRDVYTEMFSQASRENHIAYIIPFGKLSLATVSESFECIIDTLYIFAKYDFNKIATLLESILSREYELNNLTHNGELLKQFLESSPIEPEIDPDNYHPPTEWCLLFSKSNFRRYKTSELKELLQRHKEGQYTTDIFSRIEKTKNEILEYIPESMLADLKEFVIMKRKQRQSKNDTLSFQVNDRKSFLKSVLVRGFDSDMHWRHQTYYDQDAIQFVLEKYKFIKKNENKQLVYDVVSEKYIPIETNLLASVEENFGLLCASSPYSKLGIACIPPLVDYRVGDYDGKENVYVV